MRTAIAQTEQTVKAKTFMRRIGATTYRVGVHFSSTSKETAREKITRLVKNDASGKEQNILLIHEYVKRHFVSVGMCADVCIHDKKDGNPHAHIMLTMRPFELNGEWGAKQKKEYILDENGDKIYDPKRRQYKCTKIETTDWNAQTKAEEWRQGWADICNEALKQNDVTDRVDHRSFERQGSEQIPTIHLGPSASQMEKRGIRTERGNTNRDIAVTNQNLCQLKARIAKLQSWLKEEMKNLEQPDLADVIHEILYRKPKEGTTSRSQSIYNLKDAAKVLGCLTANKIKDIADLDETFSSMRKEQSTIRSELVTVERRMATLKNHIEQTNIYLKYKDKKTLSDSEQILFTASDKYLRGVMNGNNTLPIKKWKAEYHELALQHGKVKQKYLVLKDKVKEAELIRSSVHSIMRQEQREENQQRMKRMEI